jgi:glycosyltransferase involved in cell wall biosynthesis
MTETPPAAARILMTVDAVGGVWRHAMDLAAGLQSFGFSIVFVGLGPEPSATQKQEASGLGTLRWLDAPLDWMVDAEQELAQVGLLIANVARQEKVDLLHLNLPSQASALKVDLPVLVMSHSCVVTWFAGVRGEEAPEGWRWHHGINRRGFDRADLVLAPSHSHAAMLQDAYGRIDELHVVHNASRMAEGTEEKEDFVFAAARWWDDGKNGRVLDQAAERIVWPVIMAGANRGPNGQYLPLQFAQHRGELGHEDVIALMRRSSIFASPSLYEPFGLAALEAARADNALVLADIPTYRELWSEAALFADPKEPDAWVTAVDRLIEDVDLRRALAAKAAERSRQFDLPSQARAMASLYASLLERKPTLSAAE